MLVHSQTGNWSFSFQFFVVIVVFRAFGIQLLTEIVAAPGGRLHVHVVCYYSM